MDQDGLCNRLFSFAHLIAFAAEKKHVIEHQAFQPYADYFVGTSGRTCPVYSGHDPTPFREADSSRLLQWRDQSSIAFAKLRRRLRIDRCQFLNAGDAIDLCNPANVDAVTKNRVLQLTGFYNPANEFVRRHRSVILDYFRPRQRYANQISEYWQREKLAQSMVIGIHIRHGDYKTHAGGMLWYSEQEYLDLIKHLRIVFQDQKPLFLIATNGKFNSSLFQSDDIKFAPGHEMLDLYCLAKCDYLVGPDSTYTEWASFLGEIPRYAHRRKPIEAAGGQWNPPQVEDFVIHVDGYARCTPGHPGYPSMNWKTVVS